MIEMVIEKSKRRWTLVSATVEEEPIRPSQLATVALVLFGASLLSFSSLGPSIISPFPVLGLNLLGLLGGFGLPERMLLALITVLLFLGLFALLAYWRPSSTLLVCLIVGCALFALDFVWMLWPRRSEAYVNYINYLRAIALILLIPKSVALGFIVVSLRHNSSKRVLMATLLLTVWLSHSALPYIGELP